MRKTLRLLLGVLMVAGVTLAASSVYLYFAVENGIFERDADELIMLRDSNEKGMRYWYDNQVAWIRIYDTNIDYPVMQASNNEWYLTHDYRDNDSITGALFLDYRNASDFSDNTSLIYGHRTNGNLMLSDVAKYHDDEYFWQHMYGELVLKNRSYQLKAVRFEKISADSPLYRNLLYKTDETFLLLSTCDREIRSERDVLFLSVSQ
jgi:hypothetical protein